MKELFDGIFLFIFFVSITYIVYMIVRVLHLFIGLKNDIINESNFKDIKETLFSEKFLLIFWFSFSYFLFYLFK